MAGAYYQYIVKLLMVGAERVGKTSLLLRFTEGIFSSDQRATIGVEYKTKVTQVCEKAVKLATWDSSGREVYKAVTESYYRGTAGFMLVYDITDEGSFQKIGQMINGIKEAAPHAVLMVVGNKCDLENARVVSAEQGQSFADEHDCKFMETSASDNVNVNEMMMDVAEAIFSKIMQAE
ncbi:ras-related protein Rab-8B-like [Dysidea avara]|uniref:ras-related protein Rab-8B-like n=1 Tax=Dysidea avara TaxID=196820 RepID=UPI00332F53A2